MTAPCTSTAHQKGHHAATPDDARCASRSELTCCNSTQAAGQGCLIAAHDTETGAHCRRHMELQALELVRCTNICRASLEAIAEHAATLEELGLDGLCTVRAPFSERGVPRSLIVGGLQPLLVRGLCPWGLCPRRLQDCEHRFRPHISHMPSADPSVPCTRWNRRIVCSFAGLPQSALAVCTAHRAQMEEPLLRLGPHPASLASAAHAGPGHV